MDSAAVDSTTVDDFENVIQSTGDDIQVTEKPANSEVDTTSKCCLSNCVLLSNANPHVRSLLLWQDPLNTGTVLCSVVMVMFSLCFLSVISVVGYMGLALMIVAFAWRVYFDITSSFRSSGGASTSSTSSGTSHPFQGILEAGPILQTDRVIAWAGEATEIVNARLVRVRDMLFVKNYVDTIKCAIGLYLLTIVGAWFNLTTLVLMAVLTSFSVPKIYELYNPQIDQALGLVNDQISQVWGQVKEKLNSLPVIGKKKEKTT